MTAGWLDDLAWALLALGGLCAAALLADIYLAGRRQSMRVMEAVWPITALYLGPAAVWGYLRWGRAPAPGSTEGADTTDGESGSVRSIALSASHCGAGCVLGDIAGGWIIYGTGFVLAGHRLLAEYVLELIIAWLVGIAFQYLAIKPARGLSAREAIIDAVRADTLSILAFEIGMFAWMALAAFVIFDQPLPIDGPVFWFMMQIGLILGYATTYPMNRWLVARGIKGGM